MDEQQDESQVLETETEVIEQPVEETPEQSEDVQNLREQAAKAEALEREKAELERKNKQLFERLKKQEKSDTELSTKDVLILAKSNVEAEDIDEIVDYARFKKISVTDALSTPVIKTLLADRAEERKTASTTQKQGGARGAAKVSGEELLARAERTNEVPDTDEGMAELFKARLARRIPSRS